ncbi:MAG: tRNA uridine-5-carboxymethylaminomethyl(34) synthesis GTPase MnmE [Bacteroides sp.]|nr:tRNA uridine-5-carboxymethylaminomethyl(34) synthesis GTPase MnmE [Bacteroides sp.]
MNQDTICAISTAQGGAIGTIRVSGSEAIALVDKIFVPAGKKGNLATRKGYTLTFGQIRDGQEIVDEVLVSLFRAPHSYTGEDSVEITCHGSSYILGRVIQLLIQNGCRLAQPGEYTQRAFLNGKMDLSQAEAVADLIASSSAATHRLAMNQMRGGFSRELSELRNRLLHFSSMIELELDFGEEDVEFANQDELSSLANEIEQVIASLADSFRVGNAIRNGVPVAIIGETNAGKSTLLNLLLNDDKAIVSDIHGTTRDVIEDTTNIGGVTFRFIDTAGIRETSDEIERLGIERTFRKIEEAKIVLWIVDSSSKPVAIRELSDRLLPLCEDKDLLVVFNKSDLLADEKKKELEGLLAVPERSVLFISAKKGTHADRLKEKLVELSCMNSVDENTVIVTNARHYEALVRALEAIRRVQDGLSMGITGDFLAQDLRESILALNEIVGAVSNDEILHSIFENFCIGK